MTRALLVLLKKDLRIEARNPGVIYTMLLFAALLVVIFFYAFYTVDSQAQQAAPGVIQVALLFTASLGTGRIFDREQHDGCFEGLLLATSSHGVIFLSKVLLALLFSALMTALVVPLVVLLFDLQVAHPLALASALALGLIGFCFTGTLFGAVMTRLPFREVLTPLVVFPLVVPVFIGGVKATRLAIFTDTPGSLGTWLTLLVAFDAVFVLGTVWLFGPLMRDRY